MCVCKEYPEIEIVECLGAHMCEWVVSEWMKEKERAREKECKWVRESVCAYEWKGEKEKGREKKK